MVKNRLGYKWFVLKEFVSEFYKVPAIEAVYIFIVRKPETSYKRIVYIGATKNLFQRIRTHTVLTQLRYNRKGFVIDIYYANLNRHIEKELIIKINPPFNKMWANNKKSAEFDFWSEHNIKEKTWRYHQIFPITK